MITDLRWRITVIVILLAACLWAIYPPGEKIRLGLDLKGGVHLVLQVNTDDAVRLDTDTAMERLREDLERAGVTVSGADRVSPTEFQVKGILPAQDQLFRETAAPLEATFSRSPGAGGTYTFTMRPNEAVRLRADSVTQARQTIDRRVNELGVTEPIVAEYGSSSDQLIVQLPGVKDPQHAKRIIQSTAMLELKLVEKGPMPTKEALLQDSAGAVPSGQEVVTGVETLQGQQPETVFYLVRKVPVVTGKELRNAKPSTDENNQPAVAFTLNNEGARRFGKATGENIGRQLAIILDGQVRSAPRIDSRITDSGIIHGTFTPQEVQDLSLVLRAGALPASLTYLEERIVGPTLGADSIRSGLMASVMGLSLVALFMLIYYRLSGVNALVALACNLVILLGAMAYLGATMTLPGVAGFILTMGMGVDSNVLVFERIKEELAAQRGVKASIDAGFKRVFLTLLDTHATALISAAFLFQFGTGPIRGFATTLVFGLAANLFTSTFISRTLFEAVLRGRHAPTLSI